MRFKLDETLGRRAAAVLVEAGFDVATVSDQRLERTPDREVIDHCVRPISTHCPPASSASA